MPTAVQFSSQYRELRLIRRAPEERLLPSGAVAVVKPEIVLTFRDHLYFAVEGRNKLPDRYDEDRDDFTEQDELAWLRHHDGYGTLFHEIPEEVPEPTDIFRQIALMAARGDHEGLMGLGREEMEGHNRPEVLDLLRESIESLNAPETAVET